MKKKATQSNPLKVFNDNKAMGYKKAGGAMKDFNKSLKKAQDGMFSGPMTESKQKYMDKAKSNAVSAQKANIVYGPQGEYDRAYNSDMADIKQKENQARAYQKKGGAIKSKKK
jgi:hypothetical protein